MKSVRALLGVATTAGVTTACASGGGPPPPSPQARVDTVRIVDTVRVETESEVDSQLRAQVAGLQTQVARLQIQLLERDVQLGEMNEDLVSTRQEVVRNLAKLQSQASRAEAASGLAEAEIALQRMTQLAGGMELPEYTEAQALITEGSAEFGAENYGGSLYLATRARALAAAGAARLRSVGDEALMEGEARFAVPVPLRTTARSNVRQGPGTDYEVGFTLDPGTALIGQSYTSQWVRVVDGEGREGWIFHTLVSGSGL